MENVESIKKYIVRDVHGALHKSGAFSVVNEVEVTLHPGVGNPSGMSHYENNRLVIDLYNINGNGIKSFFKTEYSTDDDGWTVWRLTDDLDNVYDIAVKNGSKGSKGETGVGIQSIDVEESDEDEGENKVTITMSDGSSKTFVIKNGHQGSTVIHEAGDVVLDSVPGQDTEKGMTQKAITDFVNDGLSGIKRLQAITPSIVYLGKYLKYDGLMNDAGSDVSVVKSYAVDSSKAYYVTCRFATNNLRTAVCFYRSNGDKIAAYFRGDGATESYDIVKALLFPPEGAVTVKVFGSTNYHEPMLYEEVGKIDVQEVSDKVDEIIKVMPEDMSSLAKYAEIEESEIITKKSLEKTGQYGNSTDNAIIKIYTDIDTSKQYYANCRISKNNKLAAVCYYDSVGGFISPQFVGDGTTAAYNVYNAPLTLPQNTSIIKVFGNVVSEPMLYTYDGTIDLGKLYNDVEKMKNYPLKGKKIAVIGDSISTIYGNNNPYIRILASDVNKTIRSYVSWNDVYNTNDGSRQNPTNKTIGGVPLTEAMINGELWDFIPAAADVGKELFVPRHYKENDSGVRVWSQVLCDITGAVLLANASFSGSAINSSETEGRGVMFTASEAWHQCTIGRCKTRDEDGNDITPDIIIIARGTNDLSYTNNADFPSMSIDFPDMMNGSNFGTDKVGENEYNFVIAYILTIKRLRNAYPDATIVCATPNVFKRVHYDTFPTRNDAWTLPDLCNCIRRIADYMGCGLIEFDKDGITFENCYPDYIDDDLGHPTHPNKKGHRVMGEKAVADLKYALEPNK